MPTTKKRVDVESREAQTPPPPRHPSLWRRIRRTLSAQWPNVKYAFRPHKPRLIFRLAMALLRSKLEKKPRLRYVDFSLNQACNMKCEHCFATALEPAHGPNRPSPLTVEDYAQLVKEAMAMGAVNFSFQGGEPLLLKNLEEYVAAALPDRNLISVTTNGSLVTRERARALRKAGVDILTISIDSFDPSEHDTFRQMDGAHAKAMEAITFAIEEGLNVTIGATVSHCNIHSPGITDLIAFAEREKIILALIMATPAGEWAQNENILLTKEDVDILHQWEERYTYVRTDFDANLKERGCGAAKEILYLTPFGDVLSCPFIHVNLGNVRDMSLTAIRDRAMTVPAFATYAQKCLCAEDREFIADYIIPASRVGLLDGAEAFGWLHEEKRR